MGEICYSGIKYVYHLYENNKKICINAQYGDKFWQTILTKDRCPIMTIYDSFEYYGKIILGDVICLPTKPNQNNILEIFIFNSDIGSIKIILKPYPNKLIL